MSAFLSLFNKLIVLGSTRQYLGKNVGEEPEPGPDDDGANKALYICISAGLTIMAGFMSGLTIGLASIDKLEIEIKKAIGT